MAQVNNNDDEVGIGQLLLAALSIVIILYAWLMTGPGHLPG